MENIEIVLPFNIPVEFAIKIIQENIKTNTIYKCNINCVGFDKEGNVYNISANYNEVFYLVGMTCSELIRQFK